jgi:serine/threonine protein kinase
MINYGPNVTYEFVVDKFWLEMERMVDAEQNMLAHNDCVVRAFGICEGVMPEALQKLCGTHKNCRCVGLVMRYEAGGSLSKLLHHSSTLLSMVDRIRLLGRVAQVLVEIHSIGLIHGNLSSKNILLSHHVPPEIRLSGFEWSKEDDMDGALGFSSMKKTLTPGVGIPIYCAPETLLNFDNYGDGKVAQASRKTDMYRY